MRDYLRFIINFLILLLLILYLIIVYLFYFIVLFIKKKKKIKEDVSISDNMFSTFLFLFFSKFLLRKVHLLIKKHQIYRSIKSFFMQLLPTQLGVHVLDAFIA